MRRYGHTITGAGAGRAAVASDGRADMGATRSPPERRETNALLFLQPAFNSSTVSYCITIQKVLIL